MFRMLNLGVDGIITDRPAVARWVIERRSRLSSAERLLVGLAFFFGAAAPTRLPRPTRRADRRSYGVVFSSSVISQMSDSSALSIQVSKRPSREPEILPMWCPDGLL